MFDLRPVGYLLGVLVAALGVFMLLPVLVSFVFGDGQGDIFGLCAFICVAIGGAVALTCNTSRKEALGLQQVFMLTTMVWLVLPVFGALPFWLGAPGVSYIDAFFEAMSGLTTTGATVFTGLDEMSKATLLWRGMLQWFGGVGIVVVAMALLPALRVGGMQIFRTEGFDTMGKVLPRAAEISVSISYIYIALTAAAFLGYSMTGMENFDAIVHALTTIATGGFSNSDGSFASYPWATEYVAAFFMIAASLPFVRYVQFLGGSARPLFQDTQVRVFFKLLIAIIAVIVFYLMLEGGEFSERMLRETLFNVTSIITGTGYASTDYQTWGDFAVATFFLIGLIGGCAGSTCCSIKVFRYQLLWAALKAQIRQIHSPHGIFLPRYEGRTISLDVYSSVMSFFIMFMATLLIVAVLLGMTGLDFTTSISGAAAALANIGPGLGPIIGPAGTYAPLSDTAKVILAMTMLLGRLELMSVFVLFSAAFWQR
jgi:trk system potassium uptake protein TrkH